MSGAVKYLAWITREMLQAEPDARFVFGDNVQRVGMGGQAASMRGEPNAIGVATKRRPGMRDADFFCDGNQDTIGIVDRDIDRVVAALLEGRTVYVPKDGLGTGLSELPARAPELHTHIVDRFAALGDCPWAVAS